MEKKNNLSGASAELSSGIQKIKLLMHELNHDKLEEEKGKILAEVDNILANFGKEQEATIKKSLAKKGVDKKYLEKNIDITAIEKEKKFFSKVLEKILEVKPNAITFDLDETIFTTNEIADQKVEGFRPAFYLLVPILQSLTIKCGILSSRKEIPALVKKYGLQDTFVEDMIYSSRDVAVTDEGDQISSNFDDLQKSTAYLKFLGKESKTLHIDDKIGDFFKKNIGEENGLNVGTKEEMFTQGSAWLALNSTELGASISKRFGGEEVTEPTKKNILENIGEFVGDKMILSLLEKSNTKKEIFDKLQLIKSLPVERRNEENLGDYLTDLIEKVDIGRVAGSSERNRIYLNNGDFYLKKGGENMFLLSLVAFKDELLRNKFAKLENLKNPDVWTIPSRGDKDGTSLGSYLKQRGFDFDALYDKVSKLENKDDQKKLINSYIDRILSKLGYEE